MSQHIKTDPQTWSSPDPTAPVIESRVPVFTPIQRVSHKSPSRTKKIVTAWGWIEMDGPILTWEHRKLVLLALATAKIKKKWEDRSLSLWIDAYEVKKELGYKGGSGHKRFLRRLHDMKTANLKVHNNKTGRTVESSIIWKFSYDKEKTDTPRRPEIFTKTRRPKSEKSEKEEKEEAESTGLTLFEIRLSTEYMELFKDDIRVHYAPELIEELVKIEDGLIASTVLFFLTHKQECQFTIRQVLETVGAITEGMAKSRRSEITSKPEKLKSELEKFGIFVEGETLRYERHPKVFFTNPPGISTGRVVDAEPIPAVVSEEFALEAIPVGMVRSEAPEK